MINEMADNKPINNEPQSDLLPAKELFKSALVRLNLRYKAVLKIIFIPLILGILGVIAFILGVPVLGVPVSVILAVALFMAAGVFFVAANISLIELFSGEKITAPSDLKSGLKRFWPYVWLVILSSFVIFGGFILLIIPGIIFSIWFTMAIYVLVLEDKRGMEALLRSKHLVSGIFWKVVWRILYITIATFIILLPFRILGFIIGAVFKIDFSFISSIVSYVFTFPLSVAYYVVFFQNLTRTKTEPFVYDKKSARKYVITGFIGILFGLILLIFGGYYYFTR